MYATCLFCHSSLGANEAIEHFPVGRRLAYDAAKGRLWVVCAKCERWNLSPLEERWEAIEEAEHVYRDAKKRVATDNIGLARLRDGTELIRIGASLRPEFAAWRYGDQFGKRRRREWLIAGGGSAVVLAVALGGPALGLAVGGGGGAIVNVLNFGNLFYQRFVPRVRVADAEGKSLPISGFDLCKANFSFDNNDNTIRVQFPYRDWQSSRRLLATAMMTLKPGLLSTSYAELDGELAVRAMATMLPALNGGGGSARQVTRAVEAVEHNQNNVPTLLREALAATPSSSFFRGRLGSAAQIPKPLRLALEMSLHEADERRALEGELAELENRWKQAEEIAAIADGLFVSDATNKKIEDLRN